MHFFVIPALLALASAAQQQASSTATDNAVLHWNSVMTTATEKLDDPLTESRVFSIVQAAVHDALNAIEPRYQSYGAALPQARGASVEAAIAAATRDAFVELMPNEKGRIEKAYAEALESLGKGDAVARGLETGRRAAAAMLAMPAAA